MITSDDPANVLVVRRLLPVARDRVFAAWLDPASLAQWMRPGESTSSAVEVDPRIGGKFRIVMRARTPGCAGAAGNDNEHSGEYLIIDPPSRLSFTWVSAGTDHLPTVVSLELLERGTSTELILTHRRLPPTRVDAHRRGWTEIIRLLEATLMADQETG